MSEPSSTEPATTGQQDATSPAAAGQQPADQAPERNGEPTSGAGGEAPAPTVIDFDDLDLVEMSQESTDMDIEVCFPFAPDFPTSTDHRLEGGHNVVYFEIEPGNALGTHTDSPEELVICLEGENIEAWSGEKEGTLSAGQMVVIPAMDPHGFKNNGDTTARFVGFFSDHTNVSEFTEEEIQPMGSRVVKASSS